MSVLTTVSADGTEVRAVDQGQGRPILIVHPGLDDGSSWHWVAKRLSERFRVLRLHRRQYRLDLAASLPCTIEQEVDDLLALTSAIGEPVLVVGHSSGAVVALEALVRSAGPFRPVAPGGPGAAPRPRPVVAGAVLYEPPIHLRAGEWSETIDRARTALATRGPGAALTIFNRDIVGMPRRTAGLVRLLLAVLPRLRALTPHQLDDATAIDQLAVRLDEYARIEVPTVLLGGDRSPAHLGDRLDALAGALPDAQKVVLPGQGHLAQQRAPEAVARVVAAHADKTLG
ncbi:alpha/beta fold hydrolase [Rugosimonospora africana]|uniref:Alpha/beta hydrolase n=1 Tax=Rugosimonospora africana TaxID=556532 RepID=A0A8J3VQ78_9ACTN|nr:alpha/beta hydrolase [Rugosimonospora africana]GIH14859.1 alpha/beta hydrolase [Rugosimonospora africana]